MKPTKNGTGQYLECEYQVLDGEHKGRKLFPRKGRDRWVALRQQAMGVRRLER